MGPSFYPYPGIGSNSGSAVANSVAEGGVAGATAIARPSSSPVYVTGSNSGSASAHAHASSSSGTAISGAASGPVAVAGPSSHAVYVKGNIFFHNLNIYNKTNVW